MYTAPIISLLYARIMHVRIRINVVDPLPCGKISRAAFIGMSWQKHAVTFRGWWDFEVRRDFEEIRYRYMETVWPHKHNFFKLLSRVFPWWGSF